MRPQDGKDVQSLLHYADLAMYEHKVSLHHGVPANASAQV